MLDVNELRDSQIAFHRLEGVDDLLTFYHDETNNVRKLHITEAGLNVRELKVFVLGGVLHDGAPRLLDIQPLRSAMRVQANAPEIKLAHVCSGDFLSALRSLKLKIFLEWIEATGLVIHYHDLDPFFWSVVDIIDSMIPLIKKTYLLNYLPLLKSDLALVLKADIAATFDLMRRYSYPDLATGYTGEFLDDLLALIERNVGVLEERNAHELKNVIRAGRTLDGLEFIQGYSANRLIEDFSSFYRGRIALFKNAQHILDMEENIRAEFNAFPLSDHGVPVTNFRFVDSKAEPGIQISDIVVGLLGKMHTYLVDTPANQVLADRAVLSGTALENAELLRKHIDRSHASNPAFLHHVGSLHDLEKLRLFLRF